MEFRFLTRAGHDTEAFRIAMTYTRAPQSLDHLSLGRVLWLILSRRQPTLTFRTDWSLTPCLWILLLYNSSRRVWSSDSLSGLSSRKNPIHIPGTNSGGLEIVVRECTLADHRNGPPYFSGKKTGLVFLHRGSQGNRRTNTVTPWSSQRFDSLCYMKQNIFTAYIDFVQWLYVFDFYRNLQCTL